MIKYCCFYCKKINGDECTGCYNALGGKEYMKTCVIELGESGSYQCGEKGFQIKKQFKTHPFEDCWQEKV